LLVRRIRRTTELAFYQYFSPWPVLPAALGATGARAVLVRTGYRAGPTVAGAAAVSTSASLQVEPYADAIFDTDERTAPPTIGKLTEVQVLALTPDRCGLLAARRVLFNCERRAT
jgi:hypothetical protein